MIPKQSNDLGNSADALTSTTYVKIYLKNKYGDDNAKISSGIETKINTSNYSQTKIEEAGKSVTSKNIPSTVVKTMMR